MSSSGPRKPYTGANVDANVDAILARQKSTRQAELTPMDAPKGLGPLVQQRTQALRMSTIGFDTHSAHLAAPTASPHFEAIKKNLGDEGLSSMFQRNAFVQRLASRGYNFGAADRSMEQMLSTMASSSGSKGKLKIERGVAQNFFSPQDKRIELVDPTNVPYAAHEMRHAYDHLKGKLDLSVPEHRLMAEHNAFHTQTKVAGELEVPSGIDRTPYEQAQTYHGKPGYPGTVDSSTEAVRKWHADK
ncbi:hypothetical protein [Chitinolyticbacter meiyuanensis]|uniref:hypothetical protein n=1 Tax=Chitinolyticbacter meiyuanensis TaxID=682798 RepID=UPI0011E5FB11|nr:hypothetical protein [Chitinolyticbacter meiyuanensis]